MASGDLVIVPRRSANATTPPSRRGNESRDNTRKDTPTSTCHPAPERASAIRESSLKLAQCGRGLREFACNTAQGRYTARVLVGAQVGLLLLMRDHEFQRAPKSLQRWQFKAESHVLSLIVGNALATLFVPHHLLEEAVDSGVQILKLARHLVMLVGREKRLQSLLSAKRFVVGENEFEFGHERILAWRAPPPPNAEPTGRTGIRLLGSPAQRL